MPLVSPTTLESHSSSPKVGLIAGIAVGAAIFVALLLVGAGVAPPPSTHPSQIQPLDSETPKHQADQPLCRDPVRARYRNVSH